MTQNIPSQSQSKTLASKAGFTMYAVLTISQLLGYWEETGKVEWDKTEETCRFLSERH